MLINVIGFIAKLDISINFYAIISWNNVMKVTINRKG